MTLLFDSSTHWFEIPDEVHSAAWPRQTAPIPGNQWQAYLNQICLETVLPWLREKFGDEVVQTEPIAQPGFGNSSTVLRCA
ncbi:MAG: DUF1822 family protein [Leptolyngbyaceae cyanobacterium SL_5_14]|nr:DUF1822 family protein [Leptolyngbyaceae cyanobacterium SL_5_14]